MLAAVVARSGAAAASGPPLKLIAEPSAGVTPFLAMIDGARRSIELTMYELDDTRVERALAAAADRGVDVRVLLNGGYYSDAESYNAAAYRYLRARGVHVRYSATYFALTHQKTLTVDGRETAIMTLNFDGLYASTRDYAVLDRRAGDVRAVVRVFNADYGHRRIDPSDGDRDLVWSPGASSTFLGLIDSASRSIDVENEEMEYTPAIDALCAAARRGVSVKLVMTYESEWRAAFDKLRGCGVHVRLYHGQRYYVHAKLLLVDGRTALVGSQNLSTTSLDHDRELGIELGNRGIVRQLGRDFASDYAG